MEDNMSVKDKKVKDSGVNKPGTVRLIATVEDKFKRRVKANAALNGVDIQDYVIAALTAFMPDEKVVEVKSKEPVELDIK